MRWAPQAIIFLLEQTIDYFSSIRIFPNPSVTFCQVCSVWPTVTSKDIELTVYEIHSSILEGRITEILALNSHELCVCNANLYGATHFMEA